MVLILAFINTVSLYFFPNSAPLHLAVMSKSKDIISLLLKRPDIDLTVTDEI